MSQGFRLTTNNRMELMAVVRRARSAEIRGQRRDGLLRFEIRRRRRRRKAGSSAGRRRGSPARRTPICGRRFLRRIPPSQASVSSGSKGHADTVENNRCDQTGRGGSQRQGAPAGRYRVCSGQWRVSHIKRIKSPETRRNVPRLFKKLSGHTAARTRDGIALLTSCSYLYLTYFRT